MNKAVTNGNSVYHFFDIELLSEWGGKHCEHTLLYCMRSSAHFKAFAVGLMTENLVAKGWASQLLDSFIYSFLTVLISGINALMRKSGCKTHKHLHPVQAAKAFLVILSPASENTSQQPGFYYPGPIFKTLSLKEMHSHVHNTHLLASGLDKTKETRKHYD